MTAYTAAEIVEQMAKQAYGRAVQLTASKIYIGHVKQAASIPNIEREYE